MASDDLTVEEVAGECRRRRGAVENWIHTGVLVQGRRVRLAAVRVGGRWNIPRAALAAFIASCSPPAPPPLPETVTARARRAAADEREARRLLTGGRP